MDPRSERFDLIVVGGGPAGAAAATFVAMLGHRVLLLERESGPIYKIGESLLPPTIHGICAMLGVSDDISRAGFVKKMGGTFQWGKGSEPWTFSWAESPRFEPATSFAYQVERIKFDSILLDNARKKGVEVRERHRVMGPVFENGRVIGVEVVHTTGKRESLLSRYVIDASGHGSPLARLASERIYSPFFRNVALFGYFQNGKRLPEPCSGNIFCVAFDKGWFWYIPLSGDLTSVGVVIGEESLGVLEEGLSAALDRLIESCDPIRHLLSQATRVKNPPYDEVRVRKDYSYCHAKFWCPGLLLVGDAACFVDPVFSSGVHLATYAALLAARSINSILASTCDEQRALKEFERRYRREYTFFHDFLVSFYDVEQDLNSYYWAARKVTRIDAEGSEAFLRLVGGIAGTGERLYSDPKDFLRALQGGSGRVQAHRSATRTIPLLEVPLLFADGLVPSQDGLCWLEPRNG